jgi:hypothetical protein
MSDREREARRLAEMQRSGRDAVEGVYPEQFLIPAGAAALSKVKKVLTPNKTAPKVSMPPEKLHDPLKHVDNLVFDPIKDLREREARAAAFRAKRAVEDAVNRSNKLSGATLVAREIDRQQDEQEYKRGGAVKSKAFRGDGVAQRGKTKGRFV